jgi:DNA-binding MarR family transcriptional regulator
MPAADDSPQAFDELLNGIGPAFSRLRRHAPTSRKDFSRHLVLNVVAEGAGEITVGAVAQEIKVDPSVASRMVTDCITAGYLRRAASQQDSRRTVLEVTAQGEALRESFAAQQREAFEQITATWPDRERIQFARLLHKYVDDSVAFRKERDAVRSGA